MLEQARAMAPAGMVVRGRWRVTGVDLLPAAPDEEDLVLHVSVDKLNVAGFTTSQTWLRCTLRELQGFLLGM